MLNDLHIVRGNLSFYRFLITSQAKENMIIVLRVYIANCLVADVNAFCSFVITSLIT